MKNVRKNMLKRIAASLITAAMVFVSVPLTVSAHDAVSMPDEYATYSYLDEVRCENEKTQAIIEYVYAAYNKEDARYKGSGQCYGYAEMIRKYFGTSYKQKKIGRRATAKNLYKYLKKCKPGTHVRFAKGKNGSGRAHSIVLLKITKDFIWFTDGNVGTPNGIRIGKYSLKDMEYEARSCGFVNIVWTRQPKGNPSKISRPDVKAESKCYGPVTYVAWRPVKKAKKYIVYRSDSKNSGYRQVATVKASHFTDLSTDLYGSAYYKVKAVVTSKKMLTSKPVSATRRLYAPRVYLTRTGAATAELSWEAVPGAAKYNIYIYDTQKDGYRKAASVTGTSWTYESKNKYLDMMITAESDRPHSESYPEMLEYRF